MDYAIGILVVALLSLGWGVLQVLRRVERLEALLLVEIPGTPARVEIDAKVIIAAMRRAKRAGLSV